MVLFHRMKYLCNTEVWVGVQTVIFERVPGTRFVDVVLTPGLSGVVGGNGGPGRTVLAARAENVFGQNPMTHGVLVATTISMTPLGSLIGVGRNAKRVIYGEAHVSAYQLNGREVWQAVVPASSGIELVLYRARGSYLRSEDVFFRTPVTRSFPSSYQAIVVDNVPQLRRLRPVSNVAECARCRTSALVQRLLYTRMLFDDGRQASSDYCEQCRSTMTRCQSCGDFFAAGVSRCPVCNPRKFRVGGHGWRPELVFEGEETPENRGLFLGIELETQPSKASFAKSDLVCRKFEEFDPEARNFYLQRDGSIDWSGGYGIEICSHPRTEKGVLAAPWPQLMKTMKELGYRSHNGGMCGMHVHLSRDGLGPTPGRVRHVAVGMNYLIEANWLDFVRFSRRAESQLRWCGQSYMSGTANRREIAEYFAEERGIMSSTDRYLALNPANSYTVEVRLFRGTLRYETFLASIELLRTMVMLAKKETQNGLRDMTMDDIVARGKIDLGFSALPQYWESRKNAKIPTEVRLDQGVDGNPDDGDGYTNEQYEYWPDDEPEEDGEQGDYVF